MRCWGLVVVVEAALVRWQTVTVPAVAEAGWVDAWWSSSWDAGAEADAEGHHAQIHVHGHDPSALAVAGPSRRQTCSQRGEGDGDEEVAVHWTRMRMPGRQGSDLAGGTGGDVGSRSWSCDMPTRSPSRMGC